MSTLIVDIGGTKLRSEFEGIYEEYLSKDKELIPFLEDKLNRHKNIETVKVSFAGQINDGIILSAPNIKVKEKNIKEYFEKKYGIVFKIDNDLNCALLAESKRIPEKNIALLFVGSGVGAAVLENGAIIRGEKNLACEIGHIPFKKAPFLCGCGKDNCIEIFSGGAGLEKWFKYYKIEWMSLDEMKSSEDKTVKKIYENFKEGVLRAAATLVTLFNPKILVLGGGIIKANPYILDIIKNELEKYALKESLKELEIVISDIKNASLEGAKLL